MDIPVVLLEREGAVQAEYTSEDERDPEYPGATRPTVRGVGSMAKLKTTMTSRENARTAVTMSFVLVSRRCLSRRWQGWGRGNCSSGIPCAQGVGAGFKTASTKQHPLDSRFRRTLHNPRQTRRRGNPCGCPSQVPTHFRPLVRPSQGHGDSRERRSLRYPLSVRGRGLG